MATWRLALANRGTTGLGTELVSDVMTSAGVPAGEAEIHYTKTLNGPGGIEFSIPIDSAICTDANFKVGARELHLYRDSTLVWTGLLVSADVSGWAIRFSGLGFWHLFRKRLVVSDLLFDGVDQLDICWNLINHTQSQTGGALGITRYSSTPSGVTRTAVYCVENKVIVADAIEQFSGADDGFDFELTPTKQFRTYFPRRSVTTAIALNTDSNIRDFSMVRDATDLVTEARATVDAKSCNPPTVITATDSSARTTYGLLQVPVDEQSDDSALLQGLVSEELRINKQPRLSLRASLDSALPNTPAATAINLGDRITVTANRGYVALSNQSCRVVGVSVNIGRNGREFIDLDLDGVV